MVSRVIPVETFDLVIFGGTGDLALRKTLPGLDSWLDCLCWDAELEA
jgi:glucose-6-phosphate 1-dehydrogenase